MKSYGLNMAGSILIERIESKPIWSDDVVGRILFEESTEKYFLGAHSEVHGINGWIPLGLYKDIVKINELCIDETCTNEECLSALTLPTIYKGDSTSVLYAIEDITELINLVESGVGIEDNAIRPRHLNTGIDASDKINATHIPVFDSCDYFTGSTVEEVVCELYARTADSIGLSSTSAFGTYLSLSAANVDEALVQLEYTISELSADDIDCVFDILTNPTVQDVIDYLHDTVSSLKIVDLSDVENYQTGKPFMMSCGTSVVWVQLVGEYINVDYSGTNTDLQTALNDLDVRLTYLEDLGANAIAYTNNGYPFTTIGGALDYIYNNFFRPESGFYQTAIETPTSIECYENVEEALIDIIAQLGSPDSLNLDATEIDYYKETEKITVDAALDELYTFFTGFCYDECCQQAIEVPTPNLPEWESSNVKEVLEHLLDKSTEIPESGTERLTYYVNQDGSGDMSGKDAENQLPINEVKNYTYKEMVTFLLDPTDSPLEITSTIGVTGDVLIGSQSTSFVEIRTDTYNQYTSGKSIFAVESGTLYMSGVNTRCAGYVVSAGAGSNVLFVSGEHRTQLVIDSSGDSRVSGGFASLMGGANLFLNGHVDIYVDMNSALDSNDKWDDHGIFTARGASTINMRSYMISDGYTTIHKNRWHVCNGGRKPYPDFCTRDNSSVNIHGHSLNVEYSAQFLLSIFNCVFSIHEGDLTFPNGVQSFLACLASDVYLATRNVVDIGLHGDVFDPLDHVDDESNPIKFSMISIQGGRCWLAGIFNFESQSDNCRPNFVFMNSSSSAYIDMGLSFNDSCASSNPFLYIFQTAHRGYICYQGALLPQLTVSHAKHLARSLIFSSMWFANEISHSVSTSGSMYYCDTYSHIYGLDGGGC